MPIVNSEKERRLPLKEILVEGVESGLVEDLKYRPNKYFQPIEDIQLEHQMCIIRYHHELTPVEGTVSMEQVKQLLSGCVDAMQRRAHDQIFYLYPGVEAFGLNRRQTLRMGLINARPYKDRERIPQDLCVDAFLKLIAEHCPDAHKRIVRYNKPILTLRHLQQVLDHRPPSPLVWGTFLLLLLGAFAFVGLHQWGPPRIRKQLRQVTSRVSYVSKRMLRSGSDEWFAQLGEERQKIEYRYKPMPLTLVIEPKTKDENQRQELYQFLTKLLSQEFPRGPEQKTKYRLLIPHPSLSPKVYQTWQQLCKHSVPGGCKPGSWLLQIQNFRGGLRPLLGAIQEATRKVSDGLSVKPQYLGFIGSVRLVTSKMKPKPTSKPAKAKKTTPKTQPKTPAQPKAPTPSKAPAPPKTPAQPKAPTPSKAPTQPPTTPPARPQTPPARPAAPPTTPQPR